MQLETKIGNTTFLPCVCSLTLKVHKIFSFKSLEFQSLTQRENCLNPSLRKGLPEKSLSFLESRFDRNVTANSVYLFKLTSTTAWKQGHSFERACVATKLAFFASHADSKCVPNAKLSAVWRSNASFSNQCGEDDNDLNKPFVISNRAKNPQSITNAAELKQRWCICKNFD